MPNRILRDWTSSETMDSLSLGAEVFFARLIMRADDLGCFYGNPKLLKGQLFALKDYTEEQVRDWRDECKAAGIITCYTIQGKEYVQIINFGQRLRQMKGKFPTPPEIDELAKRSDDSQVTDTRPPESKRNEVEVEEIGKQKGKVFFVTVKTKYLHEKPKRIWDLQAYFEQTQQLLQIKKSNWGVAADFDKFLEANAGRMFDDDDHLYNSFKKVCNDMEQPKINGKTVAFDLSKK